MKKEKCIVLFSGGLDSRLVVKIMQERGFDVIALYFKLPFGCGCSFNRDDFKRVEFKIFDVCKGKLLKEYIDIINNAKYARGAGHNPCMDCKIFMFKKAKEYADSKGIKIIATGEVVGQRPMSQIRRAMNIIDKEIEFELTRPLIELGIRGRRREKQLELAKKHKISVPSVGGGCLLCEKLLKKRFKFLMKRGLNEEELKVSCIGRHFIINCCWIVIGRDEKENNIIEKIKGKELIIPEKMGPSAVILDKCSKEVKEKVKKLIDAYSKGGNRKEFEKYLI